MRRLQDVITSYPRTVVALAVALATFFYVRFITGYQVYISDQNLYLLLPFRHIFTDFCPRDWATWQTHHYHYTFSVLIRFLHFVSRGHLEIGMFLTWTGFIFAFIYGIYRLAVAVGADFKAFTLAMALWVLYASSSLGDSLIAMNYLVPSFMSSTIMLYAVGSLLNNRPWPAYLWLAVAALLHINYGIIGLPFFILVSCYSTTQWSDRLRIMPPVAAFIVLTLPVTIPVCLNFQANDPFIDLIFAIRAPHHLLPGAFGWQEVLTTVLPVLVALVLLLKQNIRGNPVAIFFLVLAGLLFFFFWFIQVPAVPSFFTRIFIWRLAPYLLILSYVIIARDFLRPGTAAVAGVLLAGWLCIALATVKHGSVYEIAAAILAGLLFFIVKWLAGRQYPRALETGLLSLLLISLIYLGGGVAQHRYKIIPLRVDVTGRSALMDWLREHTSPAALFLVPPDMEGVPTVAHRAIVANYKNVTVAVGTEALEWKQRMERIAHCPPLEKLGVAGYALADTLTGYYLRATPLEVLDVMGYYQADYFVTYRAHRRTGDFTAAGFVPCYADKKVLAFKRPAVPAAGSSTAGASTATAPGTAGYTPR